VAHIRAAGGRFVICRENMKIPAAVLFLVGRLIDVTVGITMRMRAGFNGGGDCFTGAGETTR
jgi:hypothetical protein